jgi:uncharacterized membrane protein YcgQ (UPF0703/DUF1980 family)
MRLMSTINQLLTHTIVFASSYILTLFLRTDIIISEQQLFASNQSENQLVAEFEPPYYCYHGLELLAAQQEAPAAQVQLVQ